ncbi:hypothetical protein OsI_38609 [Oryza sativa Indica Group]|uniref:Uncharacterized protein n=1 Tax=Oryza sativa subsp. indica TaxID=39946 RepID=B8BMB5_ORYSI|nr:hypothetical protein OsI_38609 [Oryza sativa Indica Group]
MAEPSVLLQGIKNSCKHQGFGLLRVFSHRCRAATAATTELNIAGGPGSTTSNLPISFGSGSEREEKYEQRKGGLVGPFAVELTDGEQRPVSTLMSHWIRRQGNRGCRIQHPRAPLRVASAAA